MSRPAGARGLKHPCRHIGDNPYRSRPAGARGLKPILCPTINPPALSRPAGARGLKHDRYKYYMPLSKADLGDYKNIVQMTCDSVIKGYELIKG